MRVNYALAFFSIIMTLIIVEIACQLNIINRGNNKNETTIDGTTIPVDRRSPQQVKADYLRQGIHATLIGHESGYWAMYEGDEYGFNNPLGLYNSSEIDIGVLGDSFTIGWGVNSKENFVSVLRDRYPKTLNISKAGAEPAMELKFFREYIVPKKPKIVLWVFFYNDLSDLAALTPPDWPSKYLDPKTNQQSLPDRPLIYMQGYKPPLEHIANQADTKDLKDEFPCISLEKLITLHTIRKMFGMQWKNPGDTKEGLARLKPILKTVKDTVSSWGGKLYFVYLPDWQQLANPFSGTFLDKPYQNNTIFPLINELGIPIIDLYPVFRAHPDPLSLFPYRRSGHYNAKGNYLVGKTILKYINLK